MWMNVNITGMSRQKYWPSLSSCSVCPALFSRPMLLLLFRNRHEDLLTEHGEDFWGETTRHVSHVCFLFARLLQVKCWIYLSVFLTLRRPFAWVLRTNYVNKGNVPVPTAELEQIISQEFHNKPPLPHSKKNKKNLQLTQHLLDHMGFFPLVAQ